MQLTIVYLTCGLSTPTLLKRSLLKEFLKSSTYEELSFSLSFEMHLLRDIKNKTHNRFILDLIHYHITNPYTHTERDSHTNVFKQIFQAPASDLIFISHSSFGIHKYPIGMIYNILETEMVGYFLVNGVLQLA